MAWVSLPLAGRARVGVLVSRSEMKALTPPPSPPPHKGEESYTRFMSQPLRIRTKRDHRHEAGDDGGGA
jgi:hypothetical protein